MKRMNKLNLLIAFLFFFSTTQQLAAQSLKDVFNSSETGVFYLGVDFTLARLIDATETASDIRDRSFPAINDLIVNEPKKYDLAGAFHKSNIDHDLAPVAKRNAKINAEAIKSTSSTDYDRLKEEDISKLVKGFDFGGKKGVGLLFVVDGMSKAKKGAGIWVTLIDMGAKKVLMTERLEGKAMGFGFRNYWAGSIKDVIEDIDKKKYKEWKAKYGS
ncbi:MAG: hypothetical protein H7Z13_07760 [Ferruginibacter sp.]|nr:hypothetical protein [Ferruginibacter sp.]